MILPSHATVSSHQHGQSSLEDVGKELLADTITKAPRSVNGKTNPSLEASVAPSTDDIDYNDLLVQVTSTASTNMDVLDELVHSIAPFKRNLEVVTRQAGDLEKVVAQLTNVKTAYEDQRRACLEHKKRFEALSSAHSREVETLQKAWVEERTTLTERIDSRNQNRIALYIDARRQGEAEGRQKAIQDIEENRNAQLQSHLEQLERAREEGRQEGIAEGRHLAIKDSELRYAAAIVEAREQGKREGRECPTEEDENLRELLKPYEDDKDPIGERKVSFDSHCQFL